MAWDTKSLLHLQDDISIGAALINRFHTTFESNRGIAEAIATRMIERINLCNYLADVVKSNRFQSKCKDFVPFENFEELPQLDEQDLLYISFGKYQIAQAASYAQDHIKSGGGVFKVFQFPQASLSQFFERFETPETSLSLFTAQIKSRFRSQVQHRPFILIDKNAQNENIVVQYCCSCYVGLRTVGCCSHVMCLIWFTLYTRGLNVKNPAGYLDQFFTAIAEELHFEED